LSIFQLWNAVPWRSENQGTQLEADIIRALSYLWCRDRGSLRTALGCLAHRATPRSETFRSRGCGKKPEQTITTGESTGSNLRRWQIPANMLDTLNCEIVPLPLRLKKLFTFDQLFSWLPPIIFANQPALPALEEVMENFAELMQRLLEIQSGGRQRSPELIEEDERLMDRLQKRTLAGKPPTNGKA
jgi:hypothetical protein